MPLSNPQGKHALLFGGTGLLGWGTVNELLSGYPGDDTFSRVTVVTNRRLDHKDTYWPEPAEGKPKLQLVSGINLQESSSDGLADRLREQVADVETVTQVFYFVFAPHHEDVKKECELNCDMMRAVAGAVNAACPDLESFVYSGGTRGYGIYIPGGTFTAPLVEEMADNLPQDYAKTVAYPWFRRILSDASQGRHWSWTEVCPDAVVGFSPMGSGYSLALHWAQYLSLCALNPRTENKSSSETPEMAFPGNEAAFNAKFTPVSTRMLGHISIYASLNQDSCGGKVVNALDNAEPVTFGQLWPQIAGYFGLVGTGPAGDGNAPVAPSEYISKHRHLFESNGRPKAVTAGVGAGAAQLDSVGYWLTFDRQLSGERLRSVGFDEEMSVQEGWIAAFEKFRAAGIIF